jgi:F-type H+-transporting ATPase subunit delta
MTSRTAANRYAKALFDVGVKEQVDLDAIAQTLGDFSGILRQHELLGKVLFNPAVPAPRKRAAVAELLKQVAVPPIVSKLLLLLAERDRLVILSEIVDAYQQRLLDHKNIVRAHVTTATPLAADKARAIENGLAQATGRTVTVSAAVDPTLIGGIVARIGSTVYDGSITGQLARMRKKLELA